MRGDVVLVVVVRDSMGRWTVWKEAKWPIVWCKEPQPESGQKNLSESSREPLVSGVPHEP